MRRLRLLSQFGLVLWFAYWAWVPIRALFESWPAHLELIGGDGRLYWRAAATWLAGGDPWSAYTTGVTFPPGGPLSVSYFTGPPPTVLAFAPFAWIPETLFVYGWFALTVAAAVWILRRLHLPLFWLIFPPLAQGIMMANPHVICIALLLSGSDWLRALAAPMKAYALITMVALRQWRALAILSAVGVASLVLFWPLWSRYLTDYSEVQNWLVGGQFGGYSAYRDPRLFALTAAALGALALVDLRAAGWLAVPGLWPATQFFYASFALPLRSPGLAIVLSTGFLRADAVVPWAIVAYSACRVGLALWRRWGAGRIAIA